MDGKKSNRRFKEDDVKLVYVSLENRLVRREEPLLLLHSPIFERVREIALKGIPGKAAAMTSPEKLH